MIAELLGLVDVLSKIKDINDLLTQERLKVVIEFLEAVGKVHIKSAIQELQAAQRSARPNEERSRAIGHLIVAANALHESLDRRPFLWRLMGRGKRRRQRVYLQITGCYLIVVRLYLIREDVNLARVYADKAAEAFDDYAPLRDLELRGWLFSRFTYNGGTDQAPLVCVATTEELLALMKRYHVSGIPYAYEGTLFRLAEKMVKEEREQLFSWLGPLRLSSS